MLIGFMGAGKSTIGKMLAARLGLPLHDTDALVEMACGESIAEIFQRDGEGIFRKRETAALREIPCEECVIVTGGGIVLREANVARLQELGRIVWLDVEEKLVLERVGYDRSRPLLRGDNPLEKIRELMESRRPRYEAASDFCVATSRATPAETVAQILELLHEH